MSCMNIGLESADSRNGLIIKVSVFALFTASALQYGRATVSEFRGRQ
jgi:hypothetical protein